MKAIRVRFAPSPTGQLHVGNARTALFNWLVARRNGGRLVLRIEDTDRQRSTVESERAMIEDLRWLGLDWDEGPDVGGGHGPYRQSERADRYAAAAEQLLEARAAYYCFCTAGALAAEREAAHAASRPPVYSGRCRTLPAEESARRVAAGEPAALRFAVPADHRDVTFHDIVRGDVTVNSSIIGDPIIVRSDGTAAYNFAVVVDDASMEISLVIRGEDHISNTSRQLLLYEAMGAKPPQFAHLSLVLGADHAPLSKRHGAASVSEFRERGYLPEALVNYLALLGWSPGDNEEIVALDEMVRRFDLATVSHSAAVFDFDKLAWMNRQYMKQADPARVARDAMRYFERRGFVREATSAAIDYVESLLPMAVGSVDRLEDIPERAAFIFAWNDALALQLVSSEPDAARVVQRMVDAAATAGPLLDREAFRAVVARAREITGVKGRALLHPLRVALTAAESGPELDVAVPAIDRGAALGAGSGVAPISSCYERLKVIAERLAAGPA